MMPDGHHILVHTGQHYDPMMSSVIMEELGLPSPDYVLRVGSASHAVQTARAMERIEAVIDIERPDLVIVSGDVNSTLAATLVAAKLGVPVAHVEAGLRSFDRTMPEEINRIVADEFSEYLFIHSDEARDNLPAEGIARRPHPFRRQHDDRHPGGDGGALPWAGCGGGDSDSTAGEYLLVTLHRPALVDGPMLFEVLDQLSRIAPELPVVFPGPSSDAQEDGRHRDRRRECDCSIRSAISSSCRCRPTPPPCSRTPAASRRRAPTWGFRASPCATTPSGRSRSGPAPTRCSDSIRRESRRSPALRQDHSVHPAAGMGWSRRREVGRGDLRRARKTAPRGCGARMRRPA